MTEYYARKEYVYSGGGAIFSIPFSYIDKEYIKVYINNVIYTGFTYLNDTQIRVNKTLSVGDVVVVVRETPIDDKFVTFTDTSILSSKQQNLAQDQLFNAMQETADSNVKFMLDAEAQAEKIAEEFQEQIDTFKEDINIEVLALDVRVTANTNNIQKHVEDVDKALHTATDSIDSKLAQAQTAANTAVTKATAAATSASNAKTSESNAKTSETNANTYKNNAQTYMNNAKTYQDNAKSYMDSAKSYRDSAESFKNSASSSATTATNQANLAKGYADYCAGAKTKVETIETEVQDFETDINSKLSTVIAAAEHVNSLEEATEQVLSYRDELLNLNGTLTYQEIEQKPLGKTDEIEFVFTQQPINSVVNVYVDIEQEVV